MEMQMETTFKKCWDYTYKDTHNVSKKESLGG